MGKVKSKLSKVFDNLLFTKPKMNLRVRISKVENRLAA